MRQAWEIRKRQPVEPLIGPLEEAKARYGTAAAVIFRRGAALELAKLGIDVSGLTGDKGGRYGAEVKSVVPSPRGGLGGKGGRPRGAAR